ncbi:acetyl-CoA synthetase [Halolactibacillus halophilus]|uniref:acetate--CoA ligase n=1 Tax=Halolactibacillus halophilus TaxID=306540 RepID=A0A1I5STD4_9BACI|nr:AMP-binding protein [Halolactibacillus halophilus]GEM02682.1 acetyl-coenzyme A synthetase [Halolactibacillus halophilus]SFP73948.1 acetyl-CoA synthetase [Halolactibacillus halophilus]
MALLAQPGTYNLTDYEQTYQSFNFTDYQHAHKKEAVNVAYFAVDQHVKSGLGAKIALHYVNGEEVVSYTFREVKQQVDQLVHVLREREIQVGERVYIFLPKNPTNYFAILAAIKIGAIAVPLFEGFMTDALHERINDSYGKVLITTKNFASRIDFQAVPSVTEVLYEEDLHNLTVEDDYVYWATPETPFLMHYTSGSTGQPKGVIHAHRAYLHHQLSGHWVLDLKPDDIYWCTSHPGWVTGSVYGLFAPWLNAATIVVQAGRFDAKQWYRVIDRLKVTVLYSAPTAFRLLKAAGDVYQSFQLDSLRHVLSVGEPLNPEVITWAKKYLHVRIHDTWWMTETGGHIVVNLPSEVIKPGSMGRPFPGITVKILDDDGNEVPHGTIGQLAVKAPWPGLMQTIWKNKAKFDGYFNDAGYYLSGDLCYQDEDGYIFFSGRVDDMINARGERIGPFEVESALVKHPAVKEAGVIGKPDEVSGEIVKAYITLNDHFVETEDLIDEIKVFVKHQLSFHSAPKEITVLDELPKTQISGKILRRELKQREQLVKLS